MTDLTSRIPDESEAIMNETQQRETSTFHNLKRAIQLGVIAAEVSPANEVARYSAFAASQFLSGNSLVGAAAYGGATVLIEGAAALSTASLLDTQASEKGIAWVNAKLRRNVSEGTKLSKTTEIGTALLGGSAVSMLAVHSQEAGRTYEQNRRYGLRTTAWLGGVCAVQGALMSEGIHNPSPSTIGAAIIAVGGVIGIANRWGGRNKNMPGVEND